MFHFATLPLEITWLTIVHNEIKSIMFLSWTIWHILHYIMRAVLFLSDAALCFILYTKYWRHDPVFGCPQFVVYSLIIFLFLICYQQSPVHYFYSYIVGLVLYLIGDPQFSFFARVYIAIWMSSTLMWNELVKASKLALAGSLCFCFTNGSHTLLIG